VNDTAPPPLTESPIDLRAAILTALTTTPATHAADRARPLDTHGTEHRYDGTCALCRGEADTLTDAVLNVIDEKVVEQVTEDMWKAVRVRTLGIREGTANLDMEGAEHLAASFVGAARALLEGCENYREWTFTAKVAEEPVGYVFLLQRQAGRSPHELRERAEAERDALTARLDALRRLPERLRVMAAASGPNPDARRAALREAALLIDTALIDTAANALADDERED
jgi:hypothetical protein